MPNTVAVAAALICQGGRFSSGSASPTRPAAFVGICGRQAGAGRDRPEALSRECRRNWRDRGRRPPVRPSDRHTYPDLTVELLLYQAAIAAGTPQLLEHAALRWVAVDELEQYAFCPADAPILERLRAGGCRRSSGPPPKAPCEKHKQTPYGRPRVAPGSAWGVFQASAARRAAGGLGLQAWVKGVKVPFVQLVLQPFQRLTKALVVGHLLLAQKADHIHHIRVIHQPQNVVVGGMSFCSAARSSCRSVMASPLLANSVAVKGMLPAACGQTPAVWSTK